MELKLIVLAGAKQGLEIPLKKDKFLIGRAKECSLRAGSEAISRRHCAIVRKDDKWTVRDLGSRNGTYVNETRIAEEVMLGVGDELRVGPLHFRVESREGVPKPVIKPSPESSAEISRPKKQPPVKDVADVIQRTVAKSDGSTSEDDISTWLLNMPESSPEPNLKETMTLRLEETKTDARIPLLGEVSNEDAISEAETIAANADESVSEQPEDSGGKSGGWSLFKRGGGGGKTAPAKKAPGKLPPRQEQQTKDSREAAADILREMTRRR